MFNAEWVCNLTLLLNAEDYRNQYSDKIRKPSGKSVFLYMLGNECDFDIRKRDFTAKEANIKWLTDITQTPCKDGKLYIAPVMDCFGAEIISQWTAT